jgi:hypothetical protein
MPAIRHARFPLIASAFCALCAAPPLHAESMITGNVDTGFQQLSLANMGNVSLYAFSQQTAPAPKGVNLTVTGTLVQNGVTTFPAPTKLTGAKDKITVTKALDPGKGLKTYPPYGGPIYGLVGIPKPTVAGDSAQVQSLTGVFFGKATAVAPGLNNDPAGYIEAGGVNTGNGSQKGDAAAKTVDPVLIYSGITFSYAPSVDATVELNNPDERGAVDFFATDSNVFTSDSLNNFVADGAPLSDTLWVMSLSASESISSASDISAGFDLNPLALDEITLPVAYLKSLSLHYASLTPNQLAVLIDAQIDKEIACSLDVSGGIGTLSDFDPFPDGTTFTGAGGTDVSFADGVDAGLVAVPLPAAAPAALLLIGLLAAGALRKNLGKI